MLLKVCVFLVAALILAAKSEDFSDIRFRDPFGNFDLQPDFSSNLFQRQQPHYARDVEHVTERDREPLDPNYKDPNPGSTEEKPVLKPKPQNKPSYNPSIIPGGVVDVDATGGVTGSGPGSGLPGGLDGFGGFSSFGGHFGGNGLFGLGGFFGGVAELKPWWKGPNVCIEREESSDDENEETVESSKNDTEEVPNFFQTSISLSNCQQTPTLYECTTKVNNHGVIKTFTVRYKCCYGFERTQNGEGCNKKLELKPLLDTIDDLDVKEFKDLIATAGLEERFKNGNYTLFVPTDNALKEYTEKMSQLNDLDTKMDTSRRRRSEIKNDLSTNDLVLSHAVAGFVDLSDLVNEEIINSENNNSTIRINIYPTHNYGRMVTVNCAKIIKPNNLAKNGIVHLLDGVAAPATLSIVDILRENPRLSNLRQAFENTDLLKNFKPDGHYTLFAPTNEAFNKLDEQAKQKLLRGDSCARNILKYHVTGHTVCSSAINGNATTRNIDDEILDLERTTDDELYLEGKAKIIETDLIATNGVIHLIDTIIIPDSALGINDVLNNLNLTKFHKLIEKAGLIDEMDNLKNSTVFAPNNDAFDDEKTRKFLDEISNDKLKELILYHTIKGQLQTCDMNNNEMLQSNDGDEKLRINLYSTLPLFTNLINKATVNCARLTGFDEKSCGSIIHEVDKFLIPPNKNIYELIENDSKYSTLIEIIKGTEVEEILKNSTESLTFLAPTDETFASLDENDIKSLKDDKKKANDLLKNHILHEVLCCSGVGPQAWGISSLVQTLANQHHQVGRTGSHQIRIGRAVVTSCDNLATNGVVHTINNVLFPIRRPATPSIGGFFLLDL